MSRKLINQDAAYALGEEAFRAGFSKGWDACHEVFTSHSFASRDYNECEEEAWSDYEPSEVVKELIGS